MQCQIKKNLYLQHQEPGNTYFFQKVNLESTYALIIQEFTK